MNVSEVILPCYISEAGRDNSGRLMCNIEMANSDTCILLPFSPLAPGSIQLNFIWVIFRLILVIDGWYIFCEIILRWMSRDLVDDKSV